MSGPQHGYFTKLDLAVDGGTVDDEQFGPRFQLTNLAYSAREKKRCEYAAIHPEDSQDEG